MTSLGPKGGLSRRGTPFRTEGPPQRILAKGPMHLHDPLTLQKTREFLLTSFCRTRDSCFLAVSPTGTPGRSRLDTEAGPGRRRRTAHLCRGIRRRVRPSRAGLLSVGWGAPVSRRSHHRSVSGPVDPRPRPWRLGLSHKRAHRRRESRKNLGQGHKITCNPVNNT